MPRRCRSGNTAGGLSDCASTGRRGAARRIGHSPTALGPPATLLPPAGRAQDGQIRTFNRYRAGEMYTRSHRERLNEYWPESRRK